MSTPFAIAGVTAVLRERLADRFSRENLSAVVGNITISAMPPDRVVLSGDTDPTQVNLFLYQVSLNAGWRNVDLPSRDSSGTRVAAPPMAVDLHYLITVYGADALFSEVLLGHMMQVFHEQPVLSRDAVRAGLEPTGPGSPLTDALEVCELADQIELLKIMPEVLNTEEVSRLWSALQTQYRLTVAYRVTVILVDSVLSTRRALPVRVRTVGAQRLGTPLITAVAGEDGPDATIDIDSTLVIEGERLAGDDVLVLIDQIEHAPTGEALRDDRITVELESVGPDLRAGVRLVRVVHRVGLGDPQTPHRGEVSNVEPFVLRPRITASSTSTATHVVDGVTYHDGEMELEFEPAVERDQRVELLLNEFAAPADRAPRAYSFVASAGNGVPDGDDETGTVVVPFTMVAEGDYLVRARVDGAESVLTVGGDGAYSGPLETIE